MITELEREILENAKAGKADVGGTSRERLKLWHEDGFLNGDGPRYTITQAGLEALVGCFQLAETGRTDSSKPNLANVQRGITYPSEAARRKGQPVARGVLDYFPDALCAVAELSRIGNEQHNPGQPMHWAKEKSTDHADCIVRHLIGRGTIDTDGVRHAAKVAWRALALLQIEIEAERTIGLVSIDTIPEKG